MKLATALLFYGCLSLPAQHHFLGKSGLLTAASSAAPDRIARLYLESVAAGLSLDADGLNGVYVAKQYRTEHNGVTHVIFRQRFQGADVLNAEWVVNLDRDGRVLNAGGLLFNAPAGESVPSMTRSLAAVRTAVRAVDPAVTDFAPFASSQPPRGRQRVRFAAGPLPLDVEGAPVWYALRGKLHPAWNFFVAHSDRVHRYSVTVADGSQTILEQQPLTFFQNPATPRGMVFERESPQPNPNPGFRIVTPPAVVSRTMQSFRGDPVASPLGWTNGSETAGNNAVVGENVNGVGFMRPTPTSAANGEFVFPLQLGPGVSPMNYPDAANANLFYWINRAHDLHYSYGFDEQSGNYQASNFGRGGHRWRPHLCLHSLRSPVDGRGPDAEFLLFDSGFG
jgi:extracellular elastinolytic metalloproteinase